ncbi:uncharacterized protein LOC144160143 [Haemaphysalis longicornis]
MASNEFYNRSLKPVDNFEAAELQTSARNAATSLPRLLLPVVRKIAAEHAIEALARQGPGERGPRPCGSHPEDGVVPRGAREGSRRPSIGDLYDTGHRRSENFAQAAAEV